MIRKIEIQRLTIVSTKAFEAVVAAVENGIGRPDMLEFGRASSSANTYAELENLVNRSVSELGLMLFMKLDIGAVLRKESGLVRPKAQRFIIDNPLIMKEMVKHVPDAGSYAPVTILIDERPDGVHLSYDRMASFLRSYGNEEALRVAEALDSKVEALLTAAAH